MKHITKTCLFKYTENFTTKKWKFSDVKFWYFSHFWSKRRLWVRVRTASPRHIDCGYMLELPRQGSSNMYPQSMFLSRNKKNNASLGGSVGWAVRQETRRSRVQPPLRSETLFREDWSWNIFYGHPPPSADSRRAVVSFWRKNVHNSG